MAAVAAEPGAAAAAASTTTVGDGLEYEAEPGQHVAGLEPDSAAGFVPKKELCHQAESVDAVQECSQVRMEMRRPDLRVAGKALRVHAEDGHSDMDECVHTDCTHNDTGVAEELLKESFSAITPAANNEVSPHEPIACFPPCSGCDPEPSSPSVPARAVHEAETGLSASESDDPAHVNPESVCPDELEHDLLGSETVAEPAAAGDAPCSDFKPAQDAFHQRAQSPKPLPPSAEETSITESVAQNCTLSDSYKISSKDSVQLVAETEHPHSSPEPEEDESLVVCDSGVSADPERKVCAESSPDRQPEAICGLVPGSEVRVSLDHIIDDALVVSFRVGEKTFSGVLMDLSKR